MLVEYHICQWQNRGVNLANWLGFPPSFLSCIFFVYLTVPLTMDFDFHEVEYCFSYHESDRFIRLFVCFTSVGSKCVAMIYSEIGRRNIRATMMNRIGLMNY